MVYPFQEPITGVSNIWSTYMLHEAHQFILCDLPTSLIVSLKNEALHNNKGFLFYFKGIKNVIVMGHNGSQIFAVPDSNTQHISREITVK